MSRRSVQHMRELVKRGGDNKNAAEKVMQMFPVHGKRTGEKSQRVVNKLNSMR